MNSITFRKATENDIGVINELAIKIWHKHYPTIISVEQIKFMLKEMYSIDALLKQMQEGHQFTIIENNGIEIGYLSISTKDFKNYFIHKFYLEMNEHGKGFGGKLFNHVLNNLPKTAETIELAVNRINYKAINFYFKIGFTIKHSFDLEIGNGFFMNDFMMIKQIK